MMSTKTCALLRHTHEVGDFKRRRHIEGDNLVASGNLFDGPGWAERVRTIVASARAIIPNVREVA